MEGLLLGDSPVEEEVLIESFLWFTLKWMVGLTMGGVSRGGFLGPEGIEGGRVEG